MSPNEVKPTDAVHKGCGGPVIASLDGEYCGRCGSGLREDEWFTPGQQSRQIPGHVPDDLYVDHRAWPTGAAWRDAVMPRSPGELWYEAGEDPDRFRELMREAGYIVPCECAGHADGSGHCEKCKPQLPCSWTGGAR